MLIQILLKPLSQNESAVDFNTAAAQFMVLLKMKKLQVKILIQIPLTI